MSLLIYVINYHNWYGFLWDWPYPIFYYRKFSSSIHTKEKVRKYKKTHASLLVTYAIINFNYKRKKPRKPSDVFFHNEEKLLNRHKNKTCHAKYASMFINVAFLLFWPLSYKNHEGTIFSFLDSCCKFYFSLTFVVSSLLQFFLQQIMQLSCC